MAQSDDSALWGTWALHDFAVTFADGRDPMRPFKQGLLLYAPDGWMSAVLCSPDRAPLGGGSLERAGGAEPSAKVQAFDTYLSYAGRYRVEGDEVVHRVEHSLVPDVVGTELRRRFAMSSDGALQLHYEKHTRRGKTVTYTLVWHRSQDAS